jgi:uncharacterized protein (DUF2345 family)
MANNIQRNKKDPSYRFDRGGYPAEFGPFTGVIKSTADPTRSGRLQVYIDAFVSGNINGDNPAVSTSPEDDPQNWTTVSYMQQFGGATPPQPTGGSTDSLGSYPGNQNSYGMWFTPPDVGVTVLCVFVNGQRDQGYYIGTVPEQGLGSMLPAIGSSSQYVVDDNNENQKQYFSESALLPVTEINTNNSEVFNDPAFFTKPKPVHSYVAGTMFQQGLINDAERGPIRSSSQRETPSAVFGVSTPGSPIYQGGMYLNDIRRKINDGSIKPGQAQVIGRVGGHTLVMDDGDLEDNNALFRLRTSKGHQITMNDSGNFLYIVHANGQTWLEFGSEGTIDLYSTNSINMRTAGDINFHADRDINMFAGRNVQIKSTNRMQLESMGNMVLDAQQDITMYSKATIGVKADGALTINSASGSWGSGSELIVTAEQVDINGPAAGKVASPNPITKTLFTDIQFNTSAGWVAAPDDLTSICSRITTHEPYPYHNKGMDVPPFSFEPGKPTPPPGATPVPAGVEIIAR